MAKGAGKGGLSSKLIMILVVGILTTIGLMVEGCAKYKEWNPMFSLLFYILIPIPLAFCPMICGADSVWGEFFGSAMILSVFAFPSVLYSNNSVEAGHYGFIMGSNVAALATTGAFFWAKNREANYGF